MKKSLLFFISLLCVGSLAGMLVFAKDKEPAVSTQGVEELDQSVVDSKPAPEEVYNLKAKLKANKQYFKYKKQIKKQEKIRTKRVNEIEYLNKRVEMKKKQLESFNPPTESEKGDDEE